MPEAPRCNTNARRHGRYSATPQELRALGRLQLCTAELVTAQLALNGPAADDAHRVEIAQHRVSRCKLRLTVAARVLDRVLMRADEERRRVLVEVAFRLADLV